jgi:hypothetical protein
VAAALMFLLTSRFAPEAHFSAVIRLPIGVVSFLVLFALMIAAATFGVFIRASYIKRKWGAFWVQMLGYLVVAFGAFVN